MSKIRIKSSLFNQNTKEENKLDILGIEKENKIIYFDSGQKVIWNKDEHILKKEVELNELIVLSFDLENPIAYCQINETKFYFEITVYEIKEDENGVKINYKINDEKVLFSLEYERVIE